MGLWEQRGKHKQKARLIIRNIKDKKYDSLALRATAVVF